MLIHLGKPEDGEQFFSERWPEARAVADSNEDLYQAFGLRRGTVGQLFGPQVMWSGMKAVFGGHGIGRPVGNPLRMSGWFLVKKDEIVWSHVHEHAGAGGRYEELLKVWTELQVSPTS